MKSLQEALPACDEDSFPNIKLLLTIACTLPVTVYENELSNSQIKLLKNCLIQQCQKKDCLV